MAVEESSQSQAPIRYMTVPEKIELGGGGGARDLPGGGGRYRPMKVPDKITLEPALPPPPPVSDLSSGEGGEGDGGVRGEFAQRLGGVGQSDVLQPSEPTHNIPTFNLQGAPAMQMSEPFVGGQTSPSLVDLERRVRTLEHQVQRLTNTVVNSRPATQSSAYSQQGNSFWYVLTFTGWMMVPLVVVFMYHFKRSL